MRGKLLTFLCLVFLSLISVSTQAKDAQKLLGTFGNWQSYAYKEGDLPVCYMVKTAKFPASKKSIFKRGPTYLMITHRPAENTKDVVSYIAGYNFKPATDVAVTIGKNSFSLFPNKDTAWSRDAKTDHALTAAIRNGSFMKVTGIPAQKSARKMTDTLDLNGAALAYQAINKACGYEAETLKKPATQRKKPHK